MENGNSPKISVIVPVYNVEKYLHRCVDSILSQTFTDFEVLLIDDGSKDKSGVICDEYAQKDKRVRVFHKQNGGVSSARNVGLDNALGEWIYFVDSDDMVLPDALDTFDSLTKSNSDLVMAGFCTSEEDDIVRERPKIIRQCELTVVEALKEMYAPFDFCYQGYLWCKLFKKCVIQQNHLRFDENISFNEDRLFIVKYLCCSKLRISYTTKAVYNYIQRMNSAMSTLQKGYNKKFATDFDAYVLMYQQISEYSTDKELIHLALNGICDSYKSNHKMMMKFNQYDRDVHRHMLKLLVQNGVIFQYLKSIIRPFVGYLGLLLLPKITIKLSNKHG